MSKQEIQRSISKIERINESYQQGYEDGIEKGISLALLEIEQLLVRYKGSSNEATVQKCKNEITALQKEIVKNGYTPK